MSSDITHFYKLRKLCETLVNLDDVVEAPLLEDLVRDIQIAATNSIWEMIKSYHEFLELPHVARTFDKWMEEQNAPNG